MVLHQGGVRAPLQSLGSATSLDYRLLCQYQHAAVVNRRRQPLACMVWGVGQWFANLGAGNELRAFSG